MKAAYDGYLGGVFHPADCGGRSRPRPPAHSRGHRGPRSHRLPESSRCRSICSRRKNFYLDRKVLDRSALHALQHAAPADRHVARQPGRAVGRLQARSRSRRRSSARTPTRPPPEHYAALMAEAKKAGGPTVHTRQTLPNWDGRYRRGATGEQWVWGRNLQTSTMVSLLTPEYQKRMVQQNYHEARQQLAAVDGVVLLSGGVHALVGAGVARRPDRSDDDAAPGAVPQRHRRQLPAHASSSAASTCRRCRSGSARPSASGTATRSSPGRRTSRAGRCRIRCSSSAARCRSIEVFRPSADGKTITVETTFYDPEAFTRPLHTVTPWQFVGGLDDPEARHHLRRMPRAEHDRQRSGRPADATDLPRRRLHRLLRPPVGAELGKAFRTGLGAAR